MDATYGTLQGDYLMRTLNGFATLCAIGLLGGDIIVGASISKIIFHFALLIVNLVFYMEGER